MTKRIPNQKVGSELDLDHPAWSMDHHHHGCSNYTKNRKKQKHSTPFHHLSTGKDLILCEAVLVLKETKDTNLFLPGLTPNPTPTKTRWIHDEGANLLMSYDPQVHKPKATISHSIQIHLR